MKKKGLFDELISDKNIYLAVYSLESYVFNPELLSKNDKKLFDQLHDKFNEGLINSTIKKVRERIKILLSDSKEYVNTQVYFKPKKYKKDGKIEFRPLHTTNLIDQIAIVAMLNLLIYEFNNKTSKIVLSNISRLIPSNFFGNRVSLKPEELFKPWTNQYKEYTRISNDSFNNYYNSLEYQYEVLLDLENFFPSINPIYLYSYILSKIPVTLTEEERELYKTILIKLLYCKIDNLKTNLDLDRYYGKSISQAKFGFCRGIPQGLPQSYFFGNVCMVEISNIFNKVFKGKSFFYVDDSVIFTNEVDELEFEKQLEKINKDIREKFQEYEKSDLFLEQYFNDKFFLNDEKLYEIRVHTTSGKSSYARISEASKGEVYLKCLSREASQVGRDMYALYSDEEDDTLTEKTSALVDVIKKEIIEVKNLYENEVDVKEKNKLESRSKKLSRYYKFFKYRKEKLSLRKSDDITKIKKLVIQSENDSIDLENFFTCYNDDIWGPAVSILIKDMTDESDIEELKRYLKNLNKRLFGFNNLNSSYIYKMNDGFLDKKQEYKYACNKYDSLKIYTERALNRFKQKQIRVVFDYIEKKLEGKKIEFILEETKILSIELKNIMRFVIYNTEEVNRMILNSIYSYLFNVEISDRFILSKTTKKNLTYGELRILVFLRSSNFAMISFEKTDIQLRSDNNCLKIDYSIMEVLDAFKVFIRHPILTDNLIQIHQYTCDVWKNGSKYLYFYTLHNQEHAVDLIKNIIKVVKMIDFIKISEQDYYILFISCYLHDISMVKIPSLDSFLIDSDEADEISIDIIEKLNKIQKKSRLSDISTIKGLLKEVYIRLDSFYERYVRDKHANDSAIEIRTRSDLSFLDKCLREIVADVAMAHSNRIEDIYYVKSDAASRLISIKFDKILLRIADLLDMSDYRISRPILNHNLEQMSSESAFHWISHLLTRGYKLETKYIVNEKSSLKPKSVIEQLILTIFVDMSQLSEIENSKKCSCVKLEQSTLQNDGFELSCGSECDNLRCNFLCKWFTKKNMYLLEEFSALMQYLKRIPDNYYDSEIIIKLQISDRTKLDAKQFEIIKENITDN